MPIIEETGLWEPLMTDKQRESYYLEKRYILLTGPRMSGKTIAAVNRVIRHAWETGDESNGARIGVFCTTIKVGLAGFVKKRLMPKGGKSKSPSPYLAQASKFVMF